MESGERGGGVGGGWVWCRWWGVGGGGGGVGGAGGWVGEWWNSVGVCFFFFQAEDGIRGLVRSRGLGDVDKSQVYF